MTCVLAFILSGKINDSSAPRRFEGVRFVLNDINAAVLARNVLFLHLCLQMPEDEEEMKKWLCATWAIWYCHELYPQHEEVLNDSLRLLCKHSSSWDNTLSHGPVQFFIHTQRGSKRLEDVAYQRS